MSSEQHVVLSRYFTTHYMAGTLPPNTRVDCEPAYKKLLRSKAQREAKRALRRAARSPLGIPHRDDTVNPVPSPVQSA